MTEQTTLGGTFILPGTTLILHRTGNGAMQLPGPGVWGPPRDADTAIAILGEAVAYGVNHIDTSDFYGPHVGLATLIEYAVATYGRERLPILVAGLGQGVRPDFLNHNPGLPTPAADFV